MSLLGVRAQDNLMAKSIAPSINYTTPKKIPVPYPVFEFLGGSASTVSSAGFNGSEVYVLNQSIIPHCRGDEAGTFGGVKSGTVSDEVEPKEGATGINVTGKALIRKDDPCYMNKRNTEGKYHIIPAPPPPPPPAKEEKKGWLDWAHDALEVVSYIPVVGSVASAVDAGLYLYEGKYEDAAFAAMGVAGPAGKVAGKTAKVVKGAMKATDAATDAAKTANKAADASKAASTAPTKSAPTPTASKQASTTNKVDGNGGATSKPNNSKTSNQTQKKDTPQKSTQSNKTDRSSSSKKPSHPKTAKHKQSQKSRKKTQESKHKHSGNKKANKIETKDPQGHITGSDRKTIPCPLNAATTIGKPINALYGSKVLMDNDDLDYQGIGYLPFYLQRLYNSQNDQVGWFGQGWKTQGLEQYLELNPQQNRIYLIDNAGRRIPFTYLKAGASCYQPYEDITLYRLPYPDGFDMTTLPKPLPLSARATYATRMGQDEHFAFVLVQGKTHPNRPDFDGIAQHFTKVIDKEDNGTFAKVLLTKQSNKYQHKLQLHYTHTDTSKQHLPSFITDDAGNCYHLGFGLYDDKPRLNCLEQVHHINETGTISQSTPLAKYHYNQEGDLCEVIIKGVSTRRFGYTDHLMTHQWFITSQEGFYTYDQTHDAKTAKVIHHTLNTGEDYRFYYDNHTDDNNQAYYTTTVVEQEGTKDERASLYEYDDWYVLTAYVDAHDNTTYYEHDHLHRLIAVHDPKGGATYYRYAGQYLSATVVKVGVNPLTQTPIYRTHTYQYDVHGRLKTITNPKNHTISLSYTHKGELSAITDELGHTTHYTYDTNGNVIKETLANQSHHHYSYDDLGNLITHTDCSGHTTTYHYHDQDHPERLTAITDAKGHTTRYGYINSHLNLVNHIQKADDTHIHLDYDQAGRLICHTDELGNQTHYTYSKDNLPVTRTDALGGILAYTYDTHRRLVKLTNENDEDWTFVYDKLDNLIRETRFDDTQSAYRYDNLSQLTALIDNPHLAKDKQRHTHLQRDLIGQLVAKHAICYQEADTNHQANTNTSTPPKRLIQTHKYAYDELGQLIRATSLDATTHLDFDPVGNLVKETLIRHHANQGQEPNKEVNSQTLTHTYDELGNRISTTLPDGTTLNNLYYGSGHLYNQSLTIQHSNTTGKDGQIIHELRHSQTNELHQEVLRQHGQSKTNQSHHTAFDYDSMGRLTKQFVSNDVHLIAQKHYTYDKKGQLTHLNTNTRLTSTHQSPNHLAKQVNYFNRTHQYTYDKLGRLTQHKLADHQTHTGHTETFAFDPASNRVPLPNSQDVHPKTKRPTKLISQNKEISYTYDSHGNIKTKTEVPIDKQGNQIAQSKNGLIGYRKSIQFVYHPNNELKQTITIIDTGLEVQRTTTSYHYDAFGRRIAKNSKVERLNKLNQNGQLVRYPTTLLHLSKTQKTQHQTTLMLWEGNRQLQEYTNHHIFTTVYDQDSFEPVSRLVQDRQDTSQIKVYHYHNNHLGTPQELTDDCGNVIWANYEYAWGGRYNHFYKEQSLNNCVIIESDLQPIRFQGQFYDVETGLHYNRFRYYDSDVGMFIQRDPIGLLGGNNVFQYAPNPVGWVDPWGLNRIKATLSLASGTSHNFEVKATSGAKTVPMRTEDAEQKLLRTIENSFSKSELKGSTLEIISQQTFMKSNGRTFPVKGMNPCEFCDNAMDNFAKNNDMRITYVNGKNKFEYPKIDGLDGKGCL
ncbi:hypothetical protein B0189_02055 [Moraxella cuniculi]|nr:RHS repeat-associated core domain-containing protein [Moraxella cuniculi]OOS07816.1 hypothetical protein B0189_02055 [Moraxella cuniculi]